jgi:hypothetical protein
MIVDIAAFDFKEIQRALSIMALQAKLSPV